MSYELFIAKRYLTAKRKQAFISLITFISVLGIAIGVMALIIAIALITGFQGDVQEKILGSTSHIMISDYSGEGLKDYDRLLPEIEDLEGIVGATPVAYDTVLLRGLYKSSGAILRGLDFQREKRFSPWLVELEQGRLPDPESGRSGILLGRDLAFAVGAGIGDAVTVLSASSRLTPIGPMPKTKTFEVTGIFHTGLYEFDSSTAVIPLSVSQKLFGLDDSISMINVRIDDIFDADAVGERIETIIPEASYVTTWMEMNKSLFSALKLEKKLLFLTITLIVLVAALNIIATLVLLVMEKSRDIGVLKAMGATSPNIRKIFFLQGAMIGVIGTAAGTFLGLVWCWLANTFELIKVPVDIYQISYVPFRISFIDLFLIIGVTLLICLTSTLFPSQRASKVDPVKALKYE